MDYDKYVKIPMFIILDRNICVGNKLLYGIIMLLSHKEGNRMIVLLFLLFLIKAG